MSKALLGYMIMIIGAGIMGVTVGLSASMGILLFVTGAYIYLGN